MLNQPDSNVLSWYRELFCPANYTTRMYKQNGYIAGQKNPWTCLRGEPADTMWHQHLDWSYPFWLGWSCPRNASDLCTTDQFTLDVDAKTESEAERAIGMVQRIIGVLGEPWFVAKTPSYGFHVYYRLDRRCELDRLMSSEKTGKIADRLQAAGLQVGREHKLEVYPQPRRCLRGPLGARQPLVDPVSLTELGLPTLSDALQFVWARRDA